MSGPTAWRTWAKPEAAPIVVAVATAVTFGLYAGARCLYKSPEVLIDKDARNDQMAESNWFAEKSDSYSRSIFRTLAQNFGRRSVFPNETSVAK